MKTNYKELVKLLTTFKMLKIFDLKTFLELAKNLPIKKIKFSTSYGNGVLLERYRVKLTVKFETSIISKIKISGYLPKNLNIIKEEYVTVRHFIANGFLIEKIDFEDEDYIDFKVYRNEENKFFIVK